MKTTLTNVILSIKPTYAQAIMLGLKKVEFRKKVFKRPVDKIFVYSSSPEQKIIGFFTIAEIIEDEPKELWKRFNKVGGIDKNAFFNYYKNSSTGFSIKVGRVEKFHNEINPKFFFRKFYPPQSYMYLEEETATNIIFEAEHKQGIELNSHKTVKKEINSINNSELIKSLMKKHKLKQKHLATILEVSQSTVSRLLNNHRKITAKDIENLSIYFKVSSEVFTLSK